MAHVLIHNTHGKDDVERASLAFVVANVARSSNQETTVLLTIDGVWVATKGYTDSLQAKGFAPLGELIEQFIAAGGQVWPAALAPNPVISLPKT